MSFLDDVTDQLNLRWAWEKVRRASTPGDVWIDEIELAGFEVQLERNLQSIADEIRKGRYRLRPLRPMAFPKSPNKDGEQQVRQYFNVAVRDQVAWTAVVNVVGPHLDRLMPAWSYGNRLFRSIWVDEDDGVRSRKIGRYRHSSGRIYLSFGQSWPVFRRHVFLATSAMTAKAGKSSSSQLTDEDAEERDLQERLKDEHRCTFVRKEYWNEREPKAGKENLYWCSVDLEKFYPSLRLDVIRRNIVERLPADYGIEAEALLDSMLHFRVDTAGWASEELKAIKLKPRQRTFKGVPTGLYVAGFISNVALLKVDLEVAERLKKRDVAHFRFVDDHVILAYSFEDLVSWVDEYLALLDASETGAKVNPGKVEPEELAAFFSSRRKSRKRLNTDTDAAATACKLNPQFPTPLMTKTLALVSAIARTDFNLLEETELVALTDQLEHMLLVELPEAEIPEKTRLSFAATRLMRLAECRLSNNARSAELACCREALDAELAELNTDLAKTNTEPAEKEGLLKRLTEWEGDSKANKTLLTKQRTELDREVGRAFSLLRKVLQERPDRVRLWTRSIQMCRHTGVQGLKDILEDIHKGEREHKAKETTLAAEYLMGNTLALLGSEALIAAQIVCDPEVAVWRRKAASAFLKDISAAPIKEPVTSGRRWFLKTSWEQFCFGLFCANLILKSSRPEEDGFDLRLPDEFLRIGEQRLRNHDEAEYPVSWAWWAARSSLRELSSRAERWVVEIGRQLPPTSESHALWRFFPFDVPRDVLWAMRDDRTHGKNLSQMAGWWHDALSTQPETAASNPHGGENRDVVRAVRNIRSASNTRFVSLQEWCKEIQATSEKDTADPRTGEWSALEIVHQIGILVSSNEEFGKAYVSKAAKGGQSPICLHPANFRVPREWLTTDAPTWAQWVSLMRPKGSTAQVEIVPEELRVADSRYTPISGPENSLFESINQVRGLGLLLYGLLRRNFELPCVWNGPGHRDVLSLLPRLLLQGMTCSSWTLGIMQACLQSRAMENLFFQAKPTLAVQLDDDSLHDPIPLRTPEEVCNVIKKCQAILEKNQLSTINHRARQLTPISIRQLSRPNWVKDFGETPEGGGFDDH
jgi:hypothetical protein